MYKKTAGIWLLTMFIISLCFQSTLFADDIKKPTEAKTVVQLDQKAEGKLLEIKYNISTIFDLQKRGIIDAEISKSQVNYYLAKGKEFINAPLEGKSLLDYINNVDDKGKPQEVSLLSKMKGLMTFGNIIIFIAIVFVVIGVVFLFSIYILPHLIMVIPRWVYEIIVYVICINCFIFAEKFPSMTHAIALLGCIGLIGAFVMTKLLHDEALEAFTKKTGISTITLANFILCVVWGLVAIYQQSQTIGFMAVIALEAFLGFSVIVTPLCYCIGFKDDDVMPRATTASFFILAAYVLQKIFTLPIPHFEIFSKGALFMGAFVYFIGLLIISSRYYRHNYILMQIITIVSGVVAMYIGLVFSVEQLVGIGGTFFALYLIEKYIDICWSNKHWAWGLTGMGITLYAIGTFITSHPQYFLITI